MIECVCLENDNFLSKKKFTLLTALEAKSPRLGRLTDLTSGEDLIAVVEACVQVRESQSVIRESSFLF